MVATFSKGNGIKVSKDDLCPICNKPDWCFWLDRDLKDAIVCGREGTSPIGWKKSAKPADDGRDIYIRESKKSWNGDRNYSYPRQPITRSKPQPIVKYPESAQSLDLSLHSLSDFPQWKETGKSDFPELERKIYYPYSDPSNGEPMARIERVEWSDRRAVYAGGKDKKICHWHWNGSEWIAKKGDRSWPLYREKEALENTKILFSLEGEKCVEAAREVGSKAICFHGSPSKFAETVEKYKSQLLLVVHICDNDEAGKKKGENIVKACLEKGIAAISFSSADIEPELKDKGDIADILKGWNIKGMSKEEQGQKLLKAVESQIDRALQEIHSQENVEASKPRNKRDRLPPADIIGEEIAEEYRDKLAFNNETRLWMEYGAEFDELWKPIAPEMINRHIRQILKQKGLSGFNSHSYVVNIWKEMEAQLIVAKWEEKPSYEALPYRNGVLNLETGKFEPHAPGNRFTWQLPRDYDPLAKDWRTIRKFLVEATRKDKGLFEIMICLCNAILKGRSDLQKFGLLIGPGGTGKGTFLNLITALIGKENIHSTDLEAWCGSNFESFNAYGKRLVLFPDEDKSVGSIGRFLSLTGGDALRGEKKGQQAFTFEFRGMALMAANIYPFTGDATSRVHRRAITIPFKNQVPESEHRDLQKEFEPELNAFINYLLRIPDDYVKRVLKGANENPTIKSESWESKISSDSLAAWVNECCVPQVDVSTPVGSQEGADPRLCLYPSYVKFCEINRLKPKAATRFTRDLKDLCKSVLNWELEDERRNIEGKQTRCIKGLRLRIEYDASLTVDQFLKDQPRQQDNNLDNNLDNTKPLPDQDLVNKTTESLPIQPTNEKSENSEIEKEPAKIMGGDHSAVLLSSPDVSESENVTPATPKPNTPGDWRYACEYVGKVFQHRKYEYLGVSTGWISHGDEGKIHIKRKDLGTHEYWKPEICIEMA